MPRGVDRTVTCQPAPGLFRAMPHDRAEGVIKSEAGVQGLLFEQPPSGYGAHLTVMQICLHPRR